MKLKSVSANNRKREFTVINRSGAEFFYPYSLATPKINTDQLVQSVFVDPELSREGFTYMVDSGTEGSVHIEQVLEFNRDPTYLADLLLYKLTIECIQRVDQAGISRRRLAERLNTSVPQLYRLLDPANSSKSMKQLVALLAILDCHVDLVVT